MIQMEVDKILSAMRGLLLKAIRILVGYVGNGSSQGTFINTGFRPAWVFIRRLDSTGNWILADEGKKSQQPCR